MSRGFAVAVFLVLSTAVVSAQDKEQDRLENCGVVMEEIVNVPDNIPHALLEKAECVIVIPSVMKAALGIGGSYGRGAMVCRSGKTFDGPWGAPAMYALESGSFGLQLGGEATDLVLLVMNDRGVNALLSTKVTLGGTMSAAAGPKGREMTASTDASMRAEIFQLLAFARPLRGRVARGRLAASRRRRQCRSLRTKDHRATDRHGEGHCGAAVGPSSRRRAAEARVAEPIEGDDEPVTPRSRHVGSARRVW